MDKSIEEARLLVLEAWAKMKGLKRCANKKCEDNKYGYHYHGENGEFEIEFHVDIDHPLLHSLIKGLPHSTELEPGSPLPSMQDFYAELYYITCNKQRAKNGWTPTSFTSKEIDKMLTTEVNNLVMAYAAMEGE